MDLPMAARLGPTYWENTTWSWKYRYLTFKGPFYHNNATPPIIQGKNLPNAIFLQEKPTFEWALLLQIVFHVKEMLPWESDAL